MVGLCWGSLGPMGGSLGPLASLSSRTPKGLFVFVRERNMVPIFRSQDLFQKGGGRCGDSLLEFFNSWVLGCAVQRLQ